MAYAHVAANVLPFQHCPQLVSGGDGGFHQGAFRSLDELDSFPILENMLLYLLKLWLSPLSNFQLFLINTGHA